MVNPFLLTTYLSIFALFIMLLYLFYRIEQSETRDLFMISILFLLIWSAGEVILRRTDVEAIAVFADRILYSIGASFIGPISLHMVLSYLGHTRRLRNEPTYAMLYIPPLFVAMIRGGTDLLTTGVRMTQWGYVNVITDLTPIFYLFVIFYFTILLVLLYQEIVKGRREGREMGGPLTVFAAYLLPVIFGIFTDVIFPLNDMDLPELTVSSTTLMAILVVHAIKRYGLMEERSGAIEDGGEGEDGVMKDREEERTSGEEGTGDDGGGPVKDARPGTIYSMGDRARSIRFFSGLVEEGWDGLAIIRMDPEGFRERMGDLEVNVHWLSGQRIQGTENIEPSSISSIFSTIIDFIRTSERPAVLLEGIEDLIFINNFKEIMKVLHSLYERVTVSGAVVIMPIDANTLDEEQWALTTRNMENL